LFGFPVRLAYQPPASSTLLSEQTSHQQSANNTFFFSETYLVSSLWSVDFINITSRQASSMCSIFFVFSCLLCFFIVFFS
jgi:hypothetical protein